MIFVRKNKALNIGSTIVKSVGILLIPSVFLES